MLGILLLYRMPITLHNSPGSQFPPQIKEQSFEMMAHQICLHISVSCFPACAILCTSWSSTIHHICHSQGHLWIWPKFSSPLICGSYPVLQLFFSNLVKAGKSAFWWLLCANSSGDDASCPTTELCPCPVRAKNPWASLVCCPRIPTTPRDGVQAGHRATGEKQTQDTGREGTSGLVYACRPNNEFILHLARLN